MPGKVPKWGQASAPSCEREAGEDYQGAANFTPPEVPLPRAPSTPLGHSQKDGAPPQASIAYSISQKLGLQLEGLFDNVNHAAEASSMSNCSFFAQKLAQYGAAPAGVTLEACSSASSSQKLADGEASHPMPLKISLGEAIPTSTVPKVESKAKETHPCIAHAMGSRGKQDLERLEWRLVEQLEGNKASLESLLEEQGRVSTQRVNDAVYHLESVFQQQHRAFTEQFKEAAQRWERQELRLEEQLKRAMQQWSSLDPPASGRSSAPMEDSLAAKLQKGNEELLQDAALQQKNLAEIKNLLKTNPLLRAMDEEGEGRRYGNGELATGSAHLGTVSAVASARHVSTREEDRDALSAVHGFEQRMTIQESESPETSRKTPEQANGIGSTMTAAYTSKFSSHYVGSDFSKRLLDVTSVVFIILNIVWMGIEVELSIEHELNAVPKPGWMDIVEIAFACVFIFELFARAAIQGSFFCSCPNIRTNLFDIGIVTVQCMDAFFTFYNVSWLRTFRILRLFNAARILRTIDYVKDLRILVAAVGGCLSSLCWVLVLLFTVLYFFMLFVMQSIYAHVSVSEVVDPALLKYYGSVGTCMLTLFKAITGGAPWETLLQPLADVSFAFVVAFVLYVTFVVCGLLNVVTAIFVESTKVLAQRDVDLKVRDLVTSKDSSVNKLRRLIMAGDADGWLSEAELEVHLANPAFIAQIKDLGMSVTEARGLYQLLDTDALGQVGIDEFVHGVIRLKCKDQSVDLATVMYENKRILTRLLAFMRFAEDHFKDIRHMLGSGPRQPKRNASALSSYLEDASKSNRDMCSIMLPDSKPLPEAQPSATSGS